MTTYGPPISIAVDACNPGEFFACCGLLELADRLWRGAEGWFDGGGFYIAPNQSENGRTLVSLLAMVSECALEQVDPADAMTSPLWLASPFDLRLDWWQDDRAGGSDLKTWAGKQNVVRIAKAMHAVIMRPLGLALPLFSLAEVLFDPADPRNTVEPFYFDNRRACQAHPLDIGFSPDAQGMTIPVHATVEFLCLIGLQRFRPFRNQEERTFEYCTWSLPLLPSAAQAVAAGQMRHPCVQRYGFRLLFRSQYLKGFLPAIPLRGD